MSMFRCKPASRAPATKASRDSSLSTSIMIMIIINTIASIAITSIIITTTISCIRMIITITIIQPEHPLLQRQDGRLSRTALPGGEAQPAEALAYLRE